MPLVKPLLIAGALGSSVVLSAVFAPPLTRPGGPGGGEVSPRILRLSPAGALGYQVFADRCTTCHGPDPLAVTRDLAIAHPLQRWNAGNSRGLHAVLRETEDQAPPAHAAVAPSFNEVEQLGRFFRDMQRWRSRVSAPG